MSDETGYDLRALFKAIGRVGIPSGGLGAVERTDATENVEMIDTNPSEITCDPLDVVGFTDGIQTSLRLAHRNSRPTVLYYVAAGCVAPTSTGKVRPIALHERLRILAGIEDHEWVSELDSDVPVETLTGGTPPEMELEVGKTISDARAKLETRLLEDLLERTDPRPVVVDGSLLGKASDARLVSVAKSARTRYLQDEAVLFTLPAGWRSPRFTINRGGGKRWSCYVQLADKNDGPWNLGLVRIETLNPDLLDPLAALCLAERQGPRSGDGRWDRHLASVRAVEEFLRAKRPAVFNG